MKMCFSLLLAATMAFVVACSSTSLAEIQAFLPDMSNIPDGVYRGNYELSGSPVKVTVDVIVLGKIIREIELIRHVRSPIGKKAEKITERIIEAQSLDVDIISGATGSSKAILKAVEHALQ